MYAIRSYYVYRVGNIKNVGDMSEDTPGSDLIKQILLDDRDDLVFLQAWGVITSYSIHYTKLYDD